MSRPGPQAYKRLIQGRRARLVLGAGGLGELEGDTAAGELAVDLGVGVQAVVDATALLLVEDDLEGLGAVLLGAEALADDLDGVDEVGQDGVVDGGQSAGAGALLLLGVARAGGSLGAGQDAARGEDQDVAVGELLLQLTGEAIKIRMSVTRSHGTAVLGCGSLPLLDTVETLQERDGDKDDNSLLAVTNLDLFKITKLACELPDDLPVSRTEPRGPLPVLFHVRPECFSVCMFAARCAVRHLSKSERFVAGRQTVSHSVEQVDGRSREIHVLLTPGCFLFRNVSGFDSYLLGRDELQRSEGSLEVGGAGLEVVEGTSDASLELRGVLAGGRVRRDLVELGRRHFDCR